MGHTYSFYVVDNLRFKQDDRPFIITSGMTLDAAIKWYKALPDTQTKALGATVDEIKTLDLVHCRPVGPDGDSHNLLVADYLRIPEWKSNSLIAVNTVSILKEHLCIIRSQFAEYQDAQCGVDEWLRLIAGYMEIIAIDRPTVMELIETITIGEAVKTDGHRVQEISIQYRFIGNLLADAKEDIA